MEIQFLITNLGGKDAIFRLLWLKEHNLEINCNNSKINVDARKHKSPRNFLKVKEINEFRSHYSQIQKGQKPSDFKKRIKTNSIKIRYPINWDRRVKNITPNVKTFTDEELMVLHWKQSFAKVNAQKKIVHPSWKPATIEDITEPVIVKDTNLGPLVEEVNTINIYEELLLEGFEDNENDHISEATIINLLKLRTKTTISQKLSHEKMTTDTGKVTLPVEYNEFKELFKEPKD